MVTVISTARGSREHGHLRRLFPEEGEGGDWRCTGAGEASVVSVLLDLLRIRTKQVVREECRVKRRGLEEERKAPAHRRR
jgi:hypothetical protein